MLVTGGGGILGSTDLGWEEEDFKSESGSGRRVCGEKGMGVGGWRCVFTWCGSRKTA
jgi:hypothetical protein